MSVDFNPDNKRGAAAPHPPPRDPKFLNSQINSRTQLSSPLGFLELFINGGVARDPRRLRGLPGGLHRRPRALPPRHGLPRRLPAPPRRWRPAVRGAAVGGRRLGGRGCLPRRRRLLPLLHRLPPPLLQEHPSAAASAPSPADGSLLGFRAEQSLLSRHHQGPNTVVDEVVKIVWKEQNMKSIALQKTRSITAVLPNKSVVLQSASVGSLLIFRGSFISTGKLQNPVVETNYTGVI